MPPKKRITAEIRNMYHEVDADLLPNVFNPNEDLHHISLPFRMCVSAPSGSGKTNFIINLIKIFSTGQGTFETIQIITRDKDEALYNQLTRDTKGRIPITEGLRTLPVLDNFDKSLNHLVIIDDLMLDKKNMPSVIEYYIRCRKCGVSIVFLAQSYYGIEPKIRGNCNYMTFLQIGTKNDLSRILSEFGMGVDLPTLKAMYEYATDKELKPFVISIGKKVQQRFRKGLDEFLNPSEFEPSRNRKLRAIEEDEDEDEDA